MAKAAAGADHNGHAPIQSTPSDPSSHTPLSNEAPAHSQPLEADRVDTADGSETIPGAIGAVKEAPPSKQKSRPLEDSKGSLNRPLSKSSPPNNHHTAPLARIPLLITAPRSPPPKSYMENNTSRNFTPEQNAACEKILSEEPPKFQGWLVDNHNFELEGYREDMEW